MLFARARGTWYSVISIGEFGSHLLLFRKILFLMELYMDMVETVEEERVCSAVLAVGEKSFRFGPFEAFFYSKIYNRFMSTPLD